MADVARITADPAVLVGKPVIRGTRLSVEFILGLLADGWSTEEICQDYAPLTREDVEACLAYALDLVRSENVYPLSS